jgi:HEAT repeat protein
MPREKVQSSKNIIEELLHSPKVEDRRNAAISLYRLKDKKAIPELIKGLGDDEDVAIFCVLALVNIGIDAIQELKKALQSGIEQVRVYSAEILGEIRADEAYEDLANVIKSDGSNWVKNTAIEAIIRLKNDKALVLLRKLIRNTNIYLAVSAGMALKKMGYKEDGFFDEMLQKLISKNEEEKSLISWAIIELSEKSDIKKIELLMGREKDKDIKIVLGEIIKEIKNR